MYSTWRIKWKAMIFSLLISLGVGALSSLLTSNAMRQYSAIRRPALSPPAVVFPIVWTALFILMAVSAYLIYESNCPEKKNALTVYAIQLIVNFFWPLFFFNCRAYFFSFIWLLLLWVLVLIMIFLFWKCHHTAALLQIPYIIWLTFAAYLNYSVWILN